MLLLLEVLLFFPLHVLVFAQNVTVTTQDARMHFNGTWVVQDSGGHEYTATFGSSVSLTFPGTAVYWHATINHLCGVANVSVDGDAGVLVDPSIGTTTNSTPIPAILFARSGLESGISHLINITLVEIGSLGGPYMEVYNLSYTQANSTSSSSISISSTTSSAANTRTDHKSNTAAIAGGFVGGVLGVLIVLGLIFLIFRRRIQSGNSLTTPYTGARSSVTGMSAKAAPTIVLSHRYPPQRPSQPEPDLPSSSSPTTVSDAIPSGQPQTTALLPPPSPHHSTAPLIPNRNETAPSDSGDPPPPYIPRRS